MSKEFLLERIQNSIKELERCDFISTATKNALYADYIAVRGGDGSVLIPKRPSAAALAGSEPPPTPPRNRKNLPPSYQVAEQQQYQQAPPPQSQPIAQERVTTTTKSKSNGFLNNAYLGIGIGIPILPFVNLGVGTSVPIGKGKQSRTETTTVTRIQEHPQQQYQTHADEKRPFNPPPPTNSSDRSFHPPKSDRPFNSSPPKTTEPYPRAGVPPPLLPKKLTSLRALRDFEGVESDDLSFLRGELITLVQKVDENWYEGSLNGRTGIFPKSYVEEL